MNREEIERKAQEYAMQFDEQYQVAMFKAWLDCAEWMQHLIKPLYDKMIEYNEDDCEEICCDIVNYDEDWCANNCGDFRKECVNKWLEAKQAMKGE